MNKEEFRNKWFAIFLRQSKIDGNEFVKDIDSLLSHQQEIGGWISCKEDCEPAHARVLLYTPEVNPGQEFGHYRIIDGRMIKHCVKNCSWTPLPSPPTVSSNPKNKEKK